mgnify:CR=1 FL=1
MKFSVLSWNIEHFKGGAARLKKVASHIRKQKPDVFALLEIALGPLTGMTKDQLGITAGASLHEIAHAVAGGGLLEYPVYTKPASWRGLEVPPVLLSGHHAEVAKWRRA